MYQKIEEAFKNKSLKNKHASLFLGFILACITILAVVLYKLNYDDYRIIIATVVGGIIIMLIAYLYIFITVIKRHKLEIVDMIDVEKILNFFKDDMQDSDVNCINSLIKENGVITKEDIKEALRHYQSLLPRKIISNGALISILAFSISVLSFIYSSKMETLEFNIELVLIIACIIIMFYFVVTTLNNKFFKIFGKYTLYERIEAALSKIYFSYSTEPKEQPILDENETVEIKNDLINGSTLEQIEENIDIAVASTAKKIEENSVDNEEASVKDGNKTTNEEDEGVILKEADVNINEVVGNEANSTPI